VAGELGLELLARAAAAVPAPGDGLCVIADYGASEGHNSLAPMRTAIRALRARLPAGAPVTVVHTDLPGNDFRSLFTVLDQDPESYLRHDQEAFAFAAGRSFYQQIFPPATVTIGWSSIAVHWLSADPPPIRDHVFAPLADREERSRIAAHAAADWSRFLALRATELVPGGQLVIVGSAADAESRSGAEPLLELANGALRAMVDDGELRADEYERMAIPTYYRTREEFTAPLRDASLGGKLALDECVETGLEDPLWAAYQANGEIESYASQVSGFLRAFSEPCLLGPLAAGRSAGEIAGLAERFYGRVREAVTAQPENGRCAWRLILLRLTRRP
jgi:hypothetical protein